MRDPDLRLAARRARRSFLIAAIAMAATVAGCLGDAGDTTKLQEQAQAALARWADAVAAAGGLPAIVPVGELTGQIGDWEVAVGDNNKRALYGGLIESDVSLPDVLPADGEVSWPDGTMERVPLISAQQAVAAIRAAATAPCDDCVALRITGAQLTTGSIETSRGPATAPLWEFAIEGTAVRVTHLAVANRVAVVPPPWDPNNPPGGVWIDSAKGTVSGRDLAVAFIGAPQPGDQPCGEDYTTEAVESDLAVVVIVVRHPNQTPGGCAGVGAMRTANVELAAPLGDRAVLQVQDGTPVPIVLTP